MKDKHNCNINCIPLPPAVRGLRTAQSKVVEHWSDTKLKFTLDGRLLGDIAEAIVAEQFGLLFPHQCEPKKSEPKASICGQPTRNARFKSNAAQLN